jgi:hypothetical protein
VKTANARVPDVAAAFGRIRRRGHFLGAWDGQVFTRDRYTTSLDNKLGLNNHFQGMARLGRHLVLSGGDPHKPAGELYVVRMASRKVTQPFRSNLWKSTLPPEDDTVIARVQVDSGRWHAGGLDATGDLVVVPLEGGGADSRVVFYDFTDPEAPRRIEEATIERDAPLASAAALAQRDDGRFVVAIWHYDTRRKLDFYLSRTKFIEDGFDGPVTVALPKGIYDFVAYQCIQFVMQEDGALFLAGFENTSEQAPTKPGVDLAHLWRVTLPGGAPLDGEWPGLAIEQVTWRQFTCRDRQANMDAGASLWVDPGGGLHAYACYHWRQDNVIRFSEFRGEPPSGGAGVDEASKAWVDLFEDRAFGGHCLSLAGRAGSDFRAYAELHVEGAHFNDKVSSVRFQLPPGQAYRLFEDEDYAGTHFDLVGTGAVVEIPDLGKVAALRGDRVSSSRWL